MKKAALFCFAVTLLICSTIAIAYSQTDYLLIKNTPDKASMHQKAGTFKTAEGDTIDIIYDVTLTNYNITITSTTGKTKIFRFGKVAWMKLDNMVYVTVPEDKNGKDKKLMELLAQNDKYKLFMFWNKWRIYYIFDHEMNLIEEPIKVTDRGVTIGSEKNNRKGLQSISLHVMNRM